ncbi:MAG: plasmid pRiA4b ORF-3 family protein [Candidatus Sabulitectum sp.]|nr:plasmid pRiA4b ORF-3 family protein [Candidatus Sabulitectum sp.]
MNNAEPSKTQLKRLFQLAGEITDINPWETVPGDLVFGVKLSGIEETGYIQIIGQLGETFGILIYRGETALHRIRRLNQQNSMLELEMFSLIFEDLSDLPPEVTQPFKSSGIDKEDCPGTPAFMSHTPGYIPALLTSGEATMLTEYLEQALDVYRRKETEQFHDLDSSDMKCLYRTYFMGQWVDSVENIPPSPELKDKYKLDSRLLKDLWNLPPGINGTQASLFLFPGSVGQPGERPSTAYLLLVVDEDTGYAVHELFAPEGSLRRMELSVPGILLKKIIEIGTKPKYLSIPEGDKLFEIINEMDIKRIPFPVKEEEDELKPLEDISEDLCNSILTGKAPAGNHSTGKQTTGQVKSNGKVLQVKVALIGNKRIYRKIAIREDQTLNDLHEAIFRAFDREEEHLYSFFFPNKATSSKQVIMKSRAFFPPMEDVMAPFGEQGNSTEATLGSLRLREKQKFYYLFDWGDEWWHELTFEGKSSTKEKILPAIIMKKGESPPQYPDWDE